MRELEKLRVICEAATVGPWATRSIGDGSPMQYVCQVEPELDLACYVDPEDAAFIAAARSVLPALLDFAEAVEAAFGDTEDASLTLWSTAAALKALDLALAGEAERETK